MIGAIFRASFLNHSWVESSGAIKPRPSQLDPNVRVSLHSAPDYIKLFQLFPCGYSRDKIHAALLDSFVSSCYDCHRYDVDELFHQFETLIHSVHIYSFVS
jgi:hypothetical protein